MKQILPIGNVRHALIVLGLLLGHIVGQSQNKAPLSLNNHPGDRLAAVPQRKIVPSMATWHMDSALIDLAAAYTPFKVLTNLRSIRRDMDVMTKDVHDQIADRALYAKGKGISLVADLDVRLALPSFEARYPNELQQMLVVEELEVKGDSAYNVLINSRVLSDHYQRSYPVRSGSFVKAFRYNITPNGIIDPRSLKDISDECTVNSATKEAVQLKVPGHLLKASSHLCVMVSFTYLYPDVFAPHLIEFREELIQNYADAGLAGAHNDEWGFPNAFSESSVQNEYWYTQYRADAYHKRTGGRNLLNDILLMHRGIAGKEAERRRAINHFQEMARERNVALENSFYKSVKESFGSEAIVAVHPTWFPYPERREFKKNGLDWWAVKRDWAQTDEVVPFGIRTALAKKWNSPVWYNMYYRYSRPLGSERADDYEEELWSSALAGGRVTNLPHIGHKAVLASNFVRAETRVNLLNYIDPAPLNCPVAVVFGHASAMNWAGPAFEEVGMNLVDSLWRLGIPTDLIPTSEIDNNSLQVDKDGYICYGPQRYAAVVLYNPEFENRATATFFNQAAKGKTKLYRIGNWTMDFNANPLGGNRLLPPSLHMESSVDLVLKEIPVLLKDKNIPLQTPATRWLEGFGHLSYAPPATGFSYLLNGTLIQVSGSGNGAGDTINSRMKIGKHHVTLDAIGVAGVRLDQEGRLEALAAGGLRSIETGSFKLILGERVDLALWKNKEGAWEGLIQGWKGEIPASLLAITSNWQRLNLPEPYPEAPAPRVKKVRLAEGKSSPDVNERLTDIDGNTYQTLKAGSQVWMAGNLRTGRFNDGTTIASPGANKLQWTKDRTGAYSWYQNDSATYEVGYGRLYNHYAVQSGKLCPRGWRVPNAQDWAILIDYLDGVSGQDGAKGFNPLAGGYRDGFGAYFALGRNGYWWSSTDTRNRTIWDQETKRLYIINDRNMSQSQGFCIRCIKD